MDYVIHYRDMVVHQLYIDMVRHYVSIFHVSKDVVFDVDDG